MEQNEICMLMDVKMDVHDKRPEAARFKKWQRCEVKIEAIKCLPSFLRLTFNEAEFEAVADMSNAMTLSIRVPVPGVSISLANSRTKQHSYGLFWMHNRRNCFIYFALETETSCRRHMKWMKKSIKNLELHRQVLLEQRRMSRGAVDTTLEKSHKLKHKDFGWHKSSAIYTLGPLPSLPNESLASSVASWSRRISRASEIYEEIFEAQPNDGRVSRRLSNVSIASGIYEEMKPSASNFNAIAEEPPQLPPRKRINTFETDAAVTAVWLSEIPRCNTNPETDERKKMKMKNVWDNIFQSGRNKRACSVSVKQASNIEELLEVNEQQPILPATTTTADISKRNSFSSPDLSKINFLETFDESKVAAAFLQHSLDLSGNVCSSADETNLPTKAMKLETEENNLNVSEEIPSNFNFSAMNCSSVNLVGANVAKQHVLVDDLTGYCFMAPIVKTLKSLPSTNSNVSSGYSTISHYSSSSSSKGVVKQVNNKQEQLGDNIYENMKQAADLSTNLYENLHAIKTTQDLSDSAAPLTASTPTDPTSTDMDSATASIIEQEGYYQTPRKSIISVDEKIPSYYPNSCGTVKMRRSGGRITPKSDSCDKSLRYLNKSQRERKENLYISSPPTSNGDTGQKSKKLTAAAAKKIAENVYTVKHALRKTASSSQNGSPRNANSSGKADDNMPEKLQLELMQLAVLQQIDFKFDDSDGVISSKEATPKTSAQCSPASQRHAQVNGKVETAAAAAAVAVTAAAVTGMSKLETRSSPLSADLQLIRKFASLPRFKKFDLSPLRLKINNVLQRNVNQDL